MSYILDALKKAERERHLAKIPTVNTVHRISWDRRRPIWLWIAGAAVLANVAVLIWLLRPEPARTRERRRHPWHPRRWRRRRRASRSRRAARRGESGEQNRDARDRAAHCERHHRSVHRPATVPQPLSASRVRKLLRNPRPSPMMPRARQRFRVRAAGIDLDALKAQDRFHACHSAGAERNGKGRHAISASHGSHACCSRKTQRASRTERAGEARRTAGRHRPNEAGRANGRTAPCASGHVSGRAGRHAENGPPGVGLLESRRAHDLHQQPEIHRRPSVEGKVAVESILPDGAILNYQGKRFELRH